MGNSVNSGKDAVRIAEAAGFRVVTETENSTHGTYVRVMDHADGRRLVITTTPGDANFVHAGPYNRPAWNGGRPVNTVSALERLLAS